MRLACLCFSNFIMSKVHASFVPLKLNLLKVYDAMTFDNPDGGVWKQGWEVS